MYDSEIIGFFDFIGFSTSGEPLEDIIDGVSFFIYEDQGGIPDSNPSFSGEAFLDLPLIIEGQGFEFFDDGQGGVPNNIRIYPAEANNGSQVLIPEGNYWAVVAVVGDGPSNGDITLELDWKSYRNTF